jgi:hypothetical protein
MGLQDLLRKSEPVPARASSPSAREGFPDSAMWSIAKWLSPFFHGAGAAFGETAPDFVDEAERNLNLKIAHSARDPRGIESLTAAMEGDPALFVRVVDFALKKITIGYPWNQCWAAANELDRYLRETGAAWRVRGEEGRLNFSLERRVDPATTELLDTLVSEGTDAGMHLSEAWTKAFGEKPDPGDAYAEALKAVEAAAGPVVCPNDRMATLGKIIGELRANASKWSSTFTEPTKDQTPVQVVTAMMDLLMKNHADRHPPVTPITQEQAETAVHLALTLVQMFRTGAITKL